MEITMKRITIMLKIRPSKRVAVESNCIVESRPINTLG
jgi:hypothetical protein